LVYNKFIWKRFCIIGQFEYFLDASTEKASVSTESTDDNVSKGGSRTKQLRKQICDDS